MAGILFGIEFVLIFTGLVFTSASRAAVFLYTAPFFVALGSYQFLGERLRALQWGGLGLSFAGVALAIGVPQPMSMPRCCSAICWWSAAARCGRATTLIAKGTELRNARAGKGARLSGRGVDPDPGAARRGCSGETITHMPGALSISLLAYQAIWVVGLHLHAVVRAGEDLFGRASCRPSPSSRRCSAWSPAYFIMHDTLTIAFGVAALLVIAGLYLVNKPDREGRAGSERAGVDAVRANQLHRPSLRGAIATKQSILHASGETGLLRFARNDGMSEVLTRLDRQRRHPWPIRPSSRHRA